MKSSRGFTWFEVLIVVAVLAILLAMLYPAVSVGPTSSPKSPAKNDVAQIANALVAYETEYGRFPTTNGDVQDVGSPILQALVGSNATLNPRGIVFIEVSPARKRKGGIRDGVYVDPWGSPYKVKLDTDYDNKLQNVGPAFSPTAKLNKKVAVWNDPDTHSDKPGEKTKTRRSVNSWQ